MIAGTVQIRDTSTPRLETIRQQAKRPRALMAAAGKRVEKDLRAHFADKDRKGNAKGWPRSHFWARTVRAATAFQGATDTGATVAISSPEFMLRLRGGTVRAKRGKYLAIPLTARAKAAGSPREGGWSGGALKFFRTKLGRALLVEASHTRLAFRGGRVAGGQQSGGEAQYLLVRSVRQRADSSALPTEAKLQAAIDNEAEKYLARELARP